jgi:hypothetical protein
MNRDALDVGSGTDQVTLVAPVLYTGALGSDVSVCPPRALPANERSLVPAGILALGTNGAMAGRCTRWLCCIE